MIKFFRKIRQKLLSENKFSQYLFYALGEIVLVVIGILIALQINNNNTKEKNLNESKEFTVRLLNEVKSNIQIANYEISRKKRHLSTATEVLDLIDKEINEQSPRTLDSLVYLILEHNAIELNLGTLNEGLNTGKIALIPSDSLKSLLYSFHSILESAKENEKYNNEDIDDFLMPYLYENVNLRQIDEANSSFIRPGKSKFEEFNNLLILNDMKFENLINNRFYHANSMIYEYEKLRLELLSLEKMIERGINSSK